MPNRESGVAGKSMLKLLGLYQHVLLLAGHGGLLPLRIHQCSTLMSRERFSHAARRSSPNPWAASTGTPSIESLPRYSWTNA